MTKYFLHFIFFAFSNTAFAKIDSTIIPLQRQLNHELIIAEQVKCDKADGTQDGMIKVSTNDEINLQVTDAIFRRISALADYIETNKKIATNNDKIRQLNYVHQLVTNFRIAWINKKIDPIMAPQLVDNFEQILRQIWIH